MKEEKIPSLTEKIRIFALGGRWKKFILCGGRSINLCD